MFTSRETPAPTFNRILNALPPEEYERLSPHLEHVTLSLRQILYRPEQPITHVYFPESGTVSTVSVLGDGRHVEVGMVGNEGMFGVNVFMGSVSTPMEAIVQLPGVGYRMRADVLRAEFKRGGRYRTCCCATPKPSSRRSRRTRRATAPTTLRGRWRSGC